RDQFLSIASHELRTPLTPIKLQLQGILRLVHEKMTPEAQKKVCDLAEKTFQQVDRLAGLLDELLDTARIGAKRLALRPQSVSPAALAREVCERYAYHDVKLETLCSSSTTTQWDRLRVEQVLVNLITNAIK